MVIVASIVVFCGFRPPVDDVDTDASDVSLSREGTPNGLYTELHNNTNIKTVIQHPDKVKWPGVR